MDTTTTDETLTVEDIDTDTAEEAVNGAFAAIMAGIVLGSIAYLVKRKLDRRKTPKLVLVEDPETTVS